MIKTSSGLPRKSWKIFAKSSANVRKLRLAFETILENLRKSSVKRQKHCHCYVHIIKKNITQLARRYEFYVLVARTIAALTRETLFLPLEHKIPIFSPPCKVLAKRRRKLTQVEDLGQLATPFGQSLRALALTCDDLRSLWSRSNLHTSRRKFFTV